MPPKKPQESRQSFWQCNVFLKLCKVHFFCVCGVCVCLLLEVTLESSRHTLPICLSQGFYSCTNIMTKNQVGEERVYSAYTSTLLFITKGSQDWNSSRAGSRSWCRGHGGMFFTGLPPLTCSAFSLIESKTTSLEMVPPTKGLSALITNWENALQLDLMEAFPQLKLHSLW